jgi:hypothetical protein
VWDFRGCCLFTTNISITDTVMRASTGISKDSMPLRVSTSLKLVSNSGNLRIFSGIDVNVVVNKVFTEI